MASWTRIAPYVSPRSLVLPGVFWGIGSAALAIAVMNLPFLCSAAFRADLAVVTVTLGPALLLWLMLVTRVCQERSAALNLSCAFGLGVFCAYIAHLQRSSPDGYFFSARWDTSPRAQKMVPVAIATFIVIPILGTAIAAAMRLLVVQIKPQPKPPAPQQWCWRCGYDISVLRSAGCPECGTDVARSRPSAATIFGIVGWFDRHRRFLVAMFVAMVLVFEAWMGWSRAIPALRFDRRFRPIALAVDNPVFDHRDMIAYAVPLSDEADRYLCVRFTPAARSRDPQMELWYAYRRYGPYFEGFVWLEWGSVPIRMELNREQTEFVMQHGLPETAVRAIGESAATSGWAPTSAIANLDRWFSTPALDPAPHFPTP